MDIYTKTGDDGLTGLFDGSRVEKEDLRVAAYGDVDELSSQIGVLRALGLAVEIDTELDDIQRDLFELSADLAMPGGAKSFAFLPGRIRDLELGIDERMDRLPPLRSFILPGGCSEAAQAHVARTVCRRAERSCWRAHRSHAYPREVLVYLNRLSDWFFALARDLNERRGIADVPWTARPPV
ncbi:MAG TPA: cob(I)yrinic acid a,c-diamide adenosyltransferase [Planctomycetota bacterium]|nr:cob(I)yrinic acid a,c-diamide adenosyltransferase [Planctomycetota bacterium]